MSKEPLTIVDGVVVDMAYVLRSQTGRELDRSDEPLTFVQGEGQIVPGLEAALYGMGSGEEKTVVVAPDEGYGEYDEEDVQEVPLSALPGGASPDLGQGLRLRNRKTGEQFEAYVVEIGPEHIVLDYNHPLAGQTLHYEVRILDVRDAVEV